MPRVTNSIERVLRHWVNKNGPLPSKHPELGSCWIWLGKTVGNGYGSLTVNYKTVRAHRWIYEQLKGNLPSYLHLHHKCEVESCVNPDHTEPSNVDHCGQFQREKTHCPQGHEYTPENTGRQGNRRYCRICRRASFKRWYDKTA